VAELNDNNTIIGHNMIIAVVDEAWRGQVTDFVAEKAFVYKLDAETYSFIGFIEDNKIVGGLLFTDYDGHNVYVHLALDDPRICQRRFIKLMFSYCFNQLRCGRVTAVTMNGKKRNEKLINGVGFTKEGVIRKAFNKGDHYVDAAVYGMLKDECKWI
jgi:RimJ/RimL family protein N-acetyltransferase